MSVNSFYNVEYEQSIIGAIIQWPEVFTEITFLEDVDFSRVNSPVWQVIVNVVQNKGVPTPLLLAEKMNSLGITLEGLQIYDYLEALRIRPVDKKGVTQIAKELKRLRLARTVYERSGLLQKKMVEMKNAPAKDIVAEVDRALGQSIVMLQTQEAEATNLLEVIPDIVESIGNNPEDTGHLKMPYDTWDRCLGPLRRGEIYMVAARQGGSKSTFLMDIMRKIPEANPDKDVKVLYLDTEMRIENAALRYVAGKVGVPYWLIDSGDWRKSPEWFPIVRRELNVIKNQKDKNIFFESIGNMSGTEMERFIKKFYLNTVGRGNSFLIVYDYLKITNKDKAESSNNKEYEMGYEKCEMLKSVAEYCDAPLWSALQMNREGIVNDKNADSNMENSASISDRIGWLLAFFGTLRRRTPEEVLQDSISDIHRASSHVMKPTKMRYLGKDGAHFNNYVKVQLGKDIKYRPNFINLDITNFSVRDKGTYEEWLGLMGKTKVKLEKHAQQDSV